MGERGLGGWSRQIPLILLVVGAGVGYYLASVARLDSFYSGNWDLGINMQMLWSTTHGQMLYESGDFESGGVRSFLLVHTTFIAIPVAYVYSLIPGADTLFALQSAAVAFSAIPLYLIGRRAGVGEPLLWAGIAVYLISFPVLSSILFDFHWESFIPAEFLWTYYLWDRKRYWLALIPAVLGVLTLEVFPILLLGLVLYGAYPWLRTLFRRPRQALQDLRLAWPRARPWVALALFAVFAYAALRISQHDLIPALVGAPSGSYRSQVTNALLTFFYYSATPSSLRDSLEYWVLLFAAFGVVPLLARQRLLLINLPWFLASLFAYPVFSDGFGNQYAFVAVAPLAIGFVEGLGLIAKVGQPRGRSVPFAAEWLLLAAPLCLVCLVDSVSLLKPTVLADLLAVGVAVAVVGIYLALVWHRKRGVRREEAAPSTRSSSSPARRPLGARPAWVMAATLTLVVASNVAMSPINPANFQASVQPGYAFDAAANPVYGYLPDLSSMMPSNAVVVASNNLFPFVADDVNAYSLSWWAAPLPYLPFNASHLPQYVLASSSQLSVAPAYLTQAIFNSSIYGTRGMLYYTRYPGSVYLFELGYTGSTDVWQVVPFENSVQICPSSLSLGPSGRVVTLAGTPCGTELAAVPASDLSGGGPTIWYGPYVTLLPGSYTVTLYLRGALSPGLPSSSAVVYLNGQSFGMTTYWYSEGLPGTAIGPTNWTGVAFQFNLSHPASGAEFRGYLTFHGPDTPADVNGTVDLEYIELQRT